MKRFLALIFTMCLFGFVSVEGRADTTLLNVSYDPTRELYQEYNAAFAKYWQKKTGENIRIRQSHGGSGKQARSVIDGLEADVVTLALAYDIDVIAQQAKLLPENWQSRLPHNSAPYTSTIVFLVRKGNPKAIKDWDDLARPGIAVISPNPKTSGGARWNYLAAWGYAQKRFGDDDEKIRAFMKSWLMNIPVMDTGARGATTTFMQRNIGDVLIAWENEALLIRRDLDKNDALEIVVPSISMLAEPPVSIIDGVVDKKKTRTAAETYLSYLYSPEGQEIVARHHYRPRDEITMSKYRQDFPELEMFTIELFGGWKKAQKEHFDDGGTFDQIMQ